MVKKYIITEQQNQQLIQTIVKNSSLKENDAWASDGGYYTKRDPAIVVSKEEAEWIKKETDELKDELFSAESVAVVEWDTNAGKFRRDILGRMKDGGIKLDYDTPSQGIDIYWLHEDEDPSEAMKEFDLVVSNLYDTVN